MSIYKTIEEKLHNSLKNDFWLQLIEGISEELEFQKLKKKEKLTLNDLDTTKDSDLMNLSTKYGYTPNLILDNSLDKLRTEVKSIPFRIKNKTTIGGLLSGFKFASRIGEIYNTTYDTNNIVRVIDFNKTIENVELYQYGNPFLDIIPQIIFFVGTNTGLKYLDEGSTLDEESLWTLDNLSYVPTTKHITLEYIYDRLINLNQSDYAITPDYIRYLLSESEYNKRSTSIPHVGLQINSIITPSYYYNNLVEDDNYTIPNLKLQSATLGDLTTGNEIIFDVDEDLRLDEFWFMDEGTTQTFTGTIDDFKYFSVGIGYKGLPSKYFSDIFSNLQLHVPFSDEDGINLDDVTNNYNCSVVGNVKRKTGILGKSLNYNIDTYGIVEDFKLSESNWTFNFWFRISNDIIGNNNKLRHIISHNNINLFYNEALNILEISLFDGTNIYTSTVTTPTDVITLDSKKTLDDTILWKLDEDTEPTTISTTRLKGRDFFCQIEFDYTNDLVMVYINSELNLVVDVSGNLGFNTTGNLYLGTSISDPSNTDYLYKGIIDELSYHSKLFNLEEKEFLYNNRFGSHKYISNAVYRIELTPLERTRIMKSDIEYFILQGKAKSNTVNDELAYISDGISNNFSTTTRFNSLKTKGFKATYITGFSDITTVIDDGYGNLISEQNASGIIDYSTGNFTLNFFKKIYIDNLVLETTSTSIIDKNFDVNIEQLSIELIYTYQGITYSAIDNGIGSLVGENISTSIIDYNLGTIYVEFTNATDIDKAVRLSYTQINTTIPNTNNEIMLEYKTNYDLELTECGFENSDKEVLQYTNFPSCKFGTTNSFLVNNTIIKILK